MRRNCLPADALLGAASMSPRGQIFEGVEEEAYEPTVVASEEDDEEADEESEKEDEEDDTSRAE